MKQLVTYLLALILGFYSFTAFAQDLVSPVPAVYKITDVAVDVTSTSAAKARDEAIWKAQRSAFTLLLDRLDVDVTLGDKLSNDDLSTLVQNFEVKNERSSSVRYIGTFAVQFRPTAVRSFLQSRNATYHDIQGSAVMVLPVTKSGDQTVLWEEQTKWRAAWARAAKDEGIVPVIVPPGEPDDQILASTSDIANGKVEPIRSLMDRYRVNNAVVAVLIGTPDNPTGDFVIDLQHVGTGYDDASAVEHMTLTGTTNKSAVEGILTQGVLQIRRKIEKEWKPSGNGAFSTTSVPSGETPTQGVPTTTSASAPGTLPVAVQFGTLAEWAEMQRKLLSTPGIQRVDITSVGRGATQIELGFIGKPEDLQLALAQRGLRLTQDILSGQWMLKGY